MLIDGETVDKEDFDIDAVDDIVAVSDSVDEISVVTVVLSSEVDDDLVDSTVSEDKGVFDSDSLGVIALNVDSDGDAVGNVEDDVATFVSVDGGVEDVGVEGVTSEDDTIVDDSVEKNEIDRNPVADGIPAVLERIGDSVRVDKNGEEDFDDIGADAEDMSSRFVRLILVTMSLTSVDCFVIVAAVRDIIDRVAQLVSEGTSWFLIEVAGRSVVGVESGEIGREDNAVGALEIVRDEEVLNAVESSMNVGSKVCRADVPGSRRSLFMLLDISD